MKHSAELEKGFWLHHEKKSNRPERFLKAINEIQKNILIQFITNWLHVVEQCGYYDQSQLIHDFKLYRNVSSTKFLKFRKDICRSKG